MADQYQLVVDVCGRPPTHNGETRTHRLAVARERRTWREAACLLARQAKIPPLGSAAVACWGRYPTRTVPDPDGVAPALKAVLDGIVDAGVLADDRDPFVTSVTYWPALVERGKPPALVVLLTTTDREHPGRVA